MGLGIQVAEKYKRCLLENCFFLGISYFISLPYSDVPHPIIQTSSSFEPTVKNRAPQPGTGKNAASTAAAVEGKSTQQQQQEGM